MVNAFAVLMVLLLLFTIWSLNMNITVHIFDDGIEFHQNGNWFYDISDWQLNSESKAQEWLEHLSDKKWFTHDIKRQFLDYCKSVQVSE